MLKQWLKSCVFLSLVIAIVSTSSVSQAWGVKSDCKTKVKIFWVVKDDLLRRTIKATLDNVINLDKGYPSKPSYKTGEPGKTYAFDRLFGSRAKKDSVLIVLSAKGDYNGNCEISASWLRAKEGMITSKVIPIYSGQSAECIYEIMNLEKALQNVLPSSSEIESLFLAPSRG